MEENPDYTIEQVCEITGKWAKYAQNKFPKWELNELHNESFLIAMALLKKGRYKKELSALQTFLSFALPLDVRHRYRRATGQRCLSDENGKRVYRQVEIQLGTIEIVDEPSDYVPMKFIEPTGRQQEWLDSRLEGDKARDLFNRGMSYQEQRIYAEELRNEQQSKRCEG
tara:strand:- start:934 stop:1440 length:507 start_codon:yes stop_codon:yes gene_type:complete